MNSAGPPSALLCDEVNHEACKFLPGIFLYKMASALNGDVAGGGYSLEKRFFTAPYNSTFSARGWAMRPMGM